MSEVFWLGRGLRGCEAVRVRGCEGARLAVRVAVCGGLGSSGTSVLGTPFFIKISGCVDAKTGGGGRKSREVFEFLVRSPVQVVELVCPLRSERSSGCWLAPGGARVESESFPTILGSRNLSRLFWHQG